MRHLYLEEMLYIKQHVSTKHFIQRYDLTLEILQIFCNCTNIFPHWHHFQSRANNVLSCQSRLSCDNSAPRTSLWIVFLKPIHVKQTMFKNLIVKATNLIVCCLRNAISWSNLFNISTNLSPLSDDSCSKPLTVSNTYPCNLMRWFGDHWHLSSDLKKQSPVIDYGYTN